jgi:twitching motility two-component system response regulator PilG
MMEIGLETNRVATETSQREKRENTTGYINGFSVSSLIQVLELEQKTCTLLARSNGAKGSIFLRKGILLDAEIDGLQGEDAAALILGWDHAQIKLVDTCNRNDKCIQSSLTRLILQASKQKDELKADSEIINDLDQAIQLVEGNHLKQAHAKLLLYLKDEPEDVKGWLWYSRCLGNLLSINKALAKCYQLAPTNSQVVEEIRKIKQATKHIQVDQVRRCPICWAPLDLKSNRCHYCRANLVISEALKQDSLKQVASKYMIDAVTRYTDVVARENNIFAIYYLSLANCNLNKAEDALDLLNEASRNNPDNKFLSDQLNIVIKHVASRLTTYENGEPTHETRTIDNKPSVQTNTKKILVVEDSSTTRKVIVLTLKQQGYALVEAQDGLEALSKIDEERPDLVLLDIILPKMDGYKILSIIKNSRDLKNTPIILLTSKDGLMDKVRGRLSGSTAYLTKPFEPKLLIETVRKHIR